jgi:hypothetical protein
MFNINKNDPWDRQFLKKLVTEEGSNSMLIGQAIEQLSSALVVHTNPFNQKKTKGSRYSSTSPHMDIGAWPLDNLGPSGFGGGQVEVTPSTIIDSVVSTRWTGYWMDCSYQAGAGQNFLTASADGVFTFQDSVTAGMSFSFPDTEAIGSDDFLRDIGAGIHLTCYLPPGATTAGTIHAYVITDTPSSNTLAGFKAASIADYHAPVTEGVTIRAPAVPKSLEFSRQSPRSDFRLGLVVLVQWDNLVHPCTWTVCRYMQHKGQSDIGPRQVNLQEHFVKNVLNAIDYGQSEYSGHLISHIPLIVSGNSFWGDFRTMTKKIIGTVIKVAPVVSEIAATIGSIL